MVLFWRKIKQRDRFKNIRDAIQIFSNEFEISGSEIANFNETRYLFPNDINKRFFYCF